ncbi:translation initiation factor IF-2 [Tepidicaulis marinus]|uniref:Translation initiation factor IF-2 n=1 Tax=Tepidicaulis marinus TaxID=1333998 RepID=A0A081B6Z8_9HYPH|nr:translation initiation factor IF-2 [Tepidicaulis marinus]GAK43816.1 translation initiation factor IF-2 [Tepidicaulis marinus]
MSDSTETGDRKKASGGKTLSLKRTVETGQVRQSFSRGRTKSVVVEKKRKRTIRSGDGEGPAVEEAPKQAAPAPEAKKPAPAAAKPVAKKAESKTADRGGMVLRTLTDEEKQARAAALEEAKEREEEERRRAQDDAKRWADEDAALAREREEAARREAEEAELRAAEEAKRLKAEEEAKRRAAEKEKMERAKAPESADDMPEPGREAKGPVRKREEPAADAVKPTPARKGEARRREGKLTITRALTDDEGGRQRSLASMRRRMEREKKRARGTSQEPRQKVARDVVIPEAITVQELANRMAERAVDVIKLLMKQGVMVQINDTLDTDTAQLVAEELGHNVKRVSEADVEEGLVTEDDPDDLKVARAPVVTVMGHVDHGKTSLLDALRKTDVVAGEAGGITQHIGAYQVTMPAGDKITFLDTPGHAAFTAMRARGAKATDLVILVVAGDDGVMPQTIEAIHHAKAAEVPMIVAINKMDKPDVDAGRVKNELLQHEVILEDFGGDVLAVEVSAKTGMGLDKLEENILLQAELLELKANPDREAEGVVIEAKLDKGRGPVATALVQRGTLKVGDIIVAGAEWGRVRALLNDRGKNVEDAGPSVPVEVLGLNGTPDAGDTFVVVENEARAREVTEYRQGLQRKARVGLVRTTLDQMMSQLKEGERHEVPIVIKGDVQGSVEAIVQALDKLGTDEVKARVLHAGVGGITESDVTLAQASGAPIIGFNVRANVQARDAARAAGIEIRYYSVIYDLVDDVKAAMSGMLSPEMRETFIGNAQILEVFNISKVGKVAGCRVTEGAVRRGSKVRLIRDDVVVHEGTLSTLKRFKDEVKEVHGGQECGMAFENYQDMRPGDVIECFDVEEIARSLD